MSDKTTLSEKVELQATLKMMDRAVAMMQAARAQVFALLHAEDVPTSSPAPARAAPAPAVEQETPAPQSPFVQPKAPPKAKNPPAQASLPAPSPAPAAPPVAAPPAAGAAASKGHGGYVHHRSRRDILAEAKSLGIPEEAMTNYQLLRDRLKPTTQGFKDSEDLISKVRAARSAQQDPTPLWTPYMPAVLPKPKI